MAENENDYVEPQFPNFYTNSVNISSNAIDFAFIFTERLDTEHNIIKARVVMTPTHAKMLLNVLTDHIAHWEKTFWTIPMPPKAISADASEPELRP